MHIAIANKHNSTTTVRSIDVSQSEDERPRCIFYSYVTMYYGKKSMNMANKIREPACQGDDWTIEVQDGEKTQMFSRPFYVASLECVNAE